MNFEEILSYLKNGEKIQRAVWKSKTCIFLVDKFGLPFLSNLSTVDFTLYESLPFIVLKNDNDKLVLYTATHEDILAKDWGVIS